MTLSLLPGSPAIDAGNNALLLASMTTDQRGYIVRTVNGGTSLTVDIGAYEYTPARLLKNQAAIDLTPCLSSTDCKTRGRAAAAIAHINRSLTASLWVNDTALTNCGELVFEQEEKAVASLIKILQQSPDLACVQAAMNAIDDLLQADEQLAVAAINVAVTAGGTAKYIKNANSEVTAARSYVAKQDYKNAIEHYEHAWEAALKARGIALNDSQCRIFKQQWDNDGDDDDDDDCH
jgi:tetratricopeptide (TPR) repeat protein